MSKFKNAEELAKAYKELEKEFTKKSQKLAIYEKDDFEDLYYKSIEQRKDLESKLAESEKKQEYLFSSNYEYVSQIEELKQQLAEKEKELAEYKRVCTIAHVEDLQIENMLLKGKDQDKISFAVEKIQELKKSLRDKVCLMENDEHCYPQNAVHWQDVVAIIDKQIKALKENK